MSTLNQRSFSGGELTPSLHGSVDLLKYQTGLKTLRNFFTLRHGGASNRSGTAFVAGTKYPERKSTLIDFVFSKDQAFALEFGEQYMRPIKNGAQIIEQPLSISNISQANPAVVTVSSGVIQFASGREILIGGVLGMTNVNGRSVRATVTSSTTFQLKDLYNVNINSLGFSAYTSGGVANLIYEISTPYLEADVSKINYVQSADVVTLVHPDYAPRELLRFADNNWALQTISFTPEQQPPQGVAVNGTAGGITYQYAVTAINSESFEESLATSAVSGALTAPNVNPHTISWTATGSAEQYNVYQYVSGVPSFVGVAGTASFTYNGTPAPDSDETPPTARNPFNGSGNFPSTVSYFQQRQAFAGADNQSETVYTSRTGFFKNFTRSSPLQDDDAITFTMAGRQVNTIRHILDLGALVVLTSSGEWSASAANGGAIKPTDINLKQHSYNGASEVRPIIVNGSALYVQDGGSIVRDLGFDFEVEGYRGNDLTIFSSHLFDGFEIVSWAYQKLPHSIIWAVRSDGALLALTYIREQEMLSWSRHDLQGGFCENITVVPDGIEDALYITVRRTIKGKTARYIEKLTQRIFFDIKDATILDSHLSFDGRNTAGSVTMTLSAASGSLWLYTDTLTLTCSSSVFTGNQTSREIHLYTGSSDVLRFNIEAVTSSTTVTGLPNRTVPTSLRNVSVSSWSMAVNSVSGLFHLDGENLSVFADGFVVASPNNPSYTTVAVGSGMITLDKAYSVIHAGIPITSDIETLNIDTAGGETLVDKSKHVSKVTLFTENTRGLFVGPSAPISGESFVYGLTEAKVRNAENYDSPVNLISGPIDVNIEPQWDRGGRVFVRQVDPIPASILSIAPAGNFPFRG